MAPTTRLRSAGDATQGKKRAVTYVEDEGSSDEGDSQEEAPERKPRKRARTHKGVKSVTKKLPASTTRTTRTKKRGRLNALPEMPLDILEEIFSFLDPGDLIRIARTTKAFRRLLLAGNQFSHLWRASWSRMEGYPECPEDFPLLKWLQLLFGGPYCQVCAAPSVQRILFRIRARMCKSCIRNSLTDVGSTWIETIQPFMLGLYIPVVHEGRNAYAYEHDLERLKTTVATALGETDASNRRETWDTILRSLREAFTPYMNHQQQCEMWQIRMIENRRDDLGERRASRRENILNRLSNLGYAESDARGIWKMKDVNVGKQLTDRAWSTLLPTLLPTLDEARQHRLEREACTRRNRRVAVARDEYAQLLRSGAVKAQDIPYFPSANACIQFGTLPSLIDEDEDEISAEWKLKLEVALKESLPLMHDAFEKHRVEFASFIQGSGAEDIVDPAAILSLATSLFIVPAEYGASEISFGLEALVRSGRKLYYHTGPAESYAASRLPRLGKSLPQSVNKVLEEILRLLGLDDTAKIVELDAADAAFTCLTCKVTHDAHYWFDNSHVPGRWHELRYRQAMNWRDVIAHVYRHHKETSDEVRLHLLTNSERAAVGAQGTVVARKRSGAQDIRARAFACCHCVDTLVAPLFDHGGKLEYSCLGDIHLHLKSSHDIEAAQEGVDYFQNPLGDRGVLGGIRSQYCLVEEPEEPVAEAAPITVAEVQHADPI
ncbi:unnamed protein product [Peniophora sp. CBMAI 1063]|nr:unnamed protein product [Peniophora sp. CBMAI 1063]